MQIHSRKMTVEKNVDFNELARSTNDFNGAQCKAVCIEAGMLALKRNDTIIKHQDYIDAVIEVKGKKKHNFHYFA